MKKGAVPLNTVTQLHSIEEFNAETAPPPEQAGESAHPVDAAQTCSEIPD